MNVTKFDFCLDTIFKEFHKSLDFNPVPLLAIVSPLLGCNFPILINHRGISYVLLFQLYFQDTFLRGY